VIDDNSLQLNYWNTFDGTYSHPLVVCCPKLASAMTLECSINDKVVYVGGTDKFDVVQGKPIIAALTFDKHMRQLAVMQLSDAAMMNVFKIKRLAHTTYDILLVSGFNGISIVQFNYDTSSFQELKTLGGLHQGEIFDFTLHKNVIYSISGRDKYIHKY
jgi:hypothetical protein